VGGPERRKSLDAGTAGDLGWLLNDLVTRVAQVDKAVILSRDGLAIGASDGLTQEDAEHLSAVAAGSRASRAERGGISAAARSGRS
jgi:predicted regulator of Ras-like GTPase activity (Roadblock/LC7/MglB family)